MTDLGKISHYLGIEVDVKVGKQISLQQTIYLKKILKHFQMAGCKPVFVLINSGVTNSFLLSEQQAD